MGTIFLVIYTDTNLITLPCSLARAGNNSNSLNTASIASKNISVTLIILYWSGIQIGTFFFFPAWYGGCVLGKKAKSYLFLCTDVEQPGHCEHPPIQDVTLHPLHACAFAPPLLASSHLPALSSCLLALLQFSLFNFLHEDSGLVVPEVNQVWPLLLPFPVPLKKPTTTHTHTHTASFNRTSITSNPPLQLNQVVIYCSPLLSEKYAQYPRCFHKQKGPRHMLNSDFANSALVLFIIEIHEFSSAHRYKKLRVGGGWGRGSESWDKYKARLSLLHAHQSNQFGYFWIT